MQPIDLQNMYSQMSNVAKTVAGQAQANQLNASLQQQTQVEKNLENATKIQKANEKSSSQNVNEDGSNGGAGAYSRGSKQKNGKKEEESSDTIQRSDPYRSTYLGTIIDITR